MSQKFITYATAYIGLIHTERDIDDGQSVGQTFTALKDFRLTQLKIWGSREGTPTDDLDIEIYAVHPPGVISGIPVGTALITTTITAPTIAAFDTALSWRVFSFGSGLCVDKDVQYCWRVRAPDDGSNDCFHTAQGAVGEVPGTKRYPYGNLLLWTGNPDLAASNYNSFSTQTDAIFQIWGELMESPASADLPGLKKRSKKLVAFANDEVWYEETPDALVGLAACTDEINCGIPLDAFEAYEKLFIANCSNMKVLDFSNCRIGTADLGTHSPNFLNTLTGGTSGAEMSVDFIDDSTANNSCYIYGKTINSTEFEEGETITGNNDDGDSVSFSAVSVRPVTTVPLWYDWTVYGGDATFGTLPKSPAIGCLYRGRAVLAGKSYDPHQWEMSRQGNPWDWNYVSNDAQSPIAGNNADVGKVGDAIVALIPRSDDFLIFGCTNSMWVLRGDAAEGGSLDPITTVTGIFGPRSWCWDAAGNLYWWGQGGIYKLPLRGESQGQVQCITANTLPDIIDNEQVDPTKHNIVMAFDRRRHGILICITTISGGANSCYWLDLRTNGLFPESYPVEASPQCLYFYDSIDDEYRHLLIGGRDGYIRYFDDDSKNDDSGDTDSAISAYVTLGPYALSSDGATEGKLVSNFITLGGGASSGDFSDSDGVQIDYFVGDDAETVLEDIKDGATAFLSTAYTGPGRKIKTRTKVRGNYCAIKCSTVATDQVWAIEKMVGNVKTTRGEIN